ncbi:hypothetical protein BH24ACT11_BH24ACT11_08790 [soil metagenome]
MRRRGCGSWLALSIVTEEKAVVARVRTWRVVAFVGSLGLTFAAAVSSTAGMVAAAQVPVVSTADHSADQQPAGSATQPTARQRVGTSRGPVQEAISAATQRLKAAQPVDVASSKRAAPTLEPRPPRSSGQGRRVVFDESSQQVWLMRTGDTVRTTYLVSGSKMDNLRPGQYEVYSRSLHAIGFNYRSTMRYMVRFTQGDNAAIGFHDIPRDNAGQPVQTAKELGVARSSGCIRQRPSDARQMWDFAQLGTVVVVVA